MHKKTLYLIDGSAYIYRAYHAIAPLTNSKGLPTNAIFGFASMIRKLIRERQPEYIAVAFDSRGPVFRHEIYTEYKANRPPMPDDLVPQIPYIKSLAQAYKLVILEEQRHEADDLIASLCRSMTAQGHDVIIVSGDKDLLQLVDDRVQMWEPMKNMQYTSQDVAQKYNLPPEKLLDYFALVGDSSDNIPGISGVGPKTASKLINEYGSLDGLYANIDLLKKSKMKEKIIKGKETAYLSRDLIRLRTDVEVPTHLDDFALQDGDEHAAQEMYKELEFYSLLHKNKSSAKLSTEGFSLANTTEKLKKIAKKIEKSTILAIDVETTSLNPRKAEIVGVSLCIDLDESWYIPVGHKNAAGQVLTDQICLSRLREFLSPFLLSQRLAKVGHNLKYDYSVICQCLDIRLQGPLIDTMIAAYLIDPSRRSYKLDDLCQDIDVQLTPFTAVTGNDKREDCFAYVEVEKACNYSCEDVYGCLALWGDYAPRLEEFELTELFSSLEMPVMPILAEMERRGVCLDLRALEELSAEFKRKITELAKHIYELAGEHFNINSPKQLGSILFTKLALPYGRKTKTGYSTDVKVLEKLARRHELPAAVLKYRTITKLQSTYVDKLRALIDEETGRVYTSFNQTVTATGRLSSSNPNLQNIPIRSDDGNRIRNAFVPTEDMIFLSADYSQIDLRVLAHYSRDEALQNAFNQGHDIHDSTARQIFANPLFITPEMRRVAKSINFGIVYGMSSYGLANQLDLGRKEAQTFIDRYFAHYSGVKKFMEESIAQARKTGYVTTLCKRRRAVPEINAKNKNLRDFAERIALNTPIQGTAADIIKLAMIAVESVIKEKKIQARLLLQIHDELVFELPQSELEVTTGHVRQAMENVLKLTVPLLVNFNAGHSLAKV